MIKSLNTICPKQDSHTECPEGYREWHSWADNMNKTHRQIRCKGCGLWAIWVPRVKGESYCIECGQTLPKGRRKCEGCKVGALTALSDATVNIGG